MHDFFNDIVENCLRERLNQEMAVRIIYIVLGWVIERLPNWYIAQIYLLSKNQNERPPTKTPRSYPTKST